MSKFFRIPTMSNAGLSLFRVFNLSTIRKTFLYSAKKIEKLFHNCQLIYDFPRANDFLKESYDYTLVLWRLVSTCADHLPDSRSAKVFDGTGRWV